MPAVSRSRYLVQAGWKDVPHLDEKTQRELLESTPPYLRAARSEGAPSLGMGAIFPIPWEEVSVVPFPIPPYWPRAYGMDVGWQATAVIWAAWDPADGTQYNYAEYCRGQAEPTIHASAIRTRGEWIRGAIDPNSRGRGQRDGEVLFDNYTDLGLNLIPANNKVAGEGGGLDYMWQQLSAGRLKFFTNLVGCENEYRLYRRDDKGRVVKKDDHRMDATRYVTMSGRDISRTKPSGMTPDHSGHINGDSEVGY